MIPRDSLLASMRPEAGAAPVDWIVSEGLAAYPFAVEAMERRAERIARGEVPECVWLVEHPPLYTVGTGTRSASDMDGPVPVFATGRGGQMTYHGPGQRVAYVMLDLKRRAPDLRLFVAALERWIIATLAAFAIAGERREDRVGVWVARRDKPPAADGSPAEDKIAAIGIRVRRWVSFHGISLNVEPDLTHYAEITPCGIAAAHLGVTSLADLGYRVTMAEVDAALRRTFEEVFGPTAILPGSEKPGPEKLGSEKLGPAKSGAYSIGP